MSRALALLFAVAAVLAGCSKAPGSPVLVEGGGVRITADDLKARANLEAPLTRGALADPAKKREYLDRMVDQEVLVAEARRQGLDRDPDLEATIKQMLVQRLVRQRLTKQTSWVPTQAELMAEYEKQKASYPVPERARVQVVAIRGEAGGRALSDRLTKLEAGRAEALKKGGGALSEDDFTALGTSVSAEINAVDPTLRSRDELAAWLGPALTAAIMALPSPGAVTELAVLPGGGKALARLVAKEPAGFVPFEQLQGPIAAALSRKHQDKLIEDWAQELKTTTHVTVNAKALETTDVVAPPPQPAPSPKP